MRQTIADHNQSELARFIDLLLELGRRNSLRDPVAQVADRIGLTSAQLHAILWLGREAPLTMGVLAQRTGVTEKTITGIVDRLERAGFAQRERNPEDRRVVQVVLTDSGTKLFEELDQGICQKLQRFLQLVDEQDRQALFRILEKLISRIDLAIPPPSDSSAGD